MEQLLQKLKSEISREDWERIEGNDAENDVRISGFLVEIDEQVDGCVIDVSFISLRKVLPFFRQVNN